MKFNWALTVGVVALLLASPNLKAQVSCSPNVDRKMCADAAQFLNPIVDHGTPYHGVGIPVEIITPAEYAKRLADTKELEKRETDYAGGMDNAAKSPDKFSVFYRHSLANGWSEDITFFRSRPSSTYVSSILISSVAFEGFTIGPIDPKTNSVQSIPSGKYDSSRLIDASAFIGGYLCGTMSKLWDGSIIASDLK
jgi:hypothetical protein